MSHNGIFQSSLVGDVDRQLFTSAVEAYCEEKGYTCVTQNAEVRDYYGNKERVDIAVSGNNLSYPMGVRFQNGKPPTYVGDKFMQNTEWSGVEKGIENTYTALCVARAVSEEGGSIRGIQSLKDSVEVLADF